MRYFYTLVVLVCYSALILTGCKSKEDELAPVADGIIFSPISDYQEAYPGALVNFDYKIKSAEPLTSFKVQFMLPGSTVFTDLPQYPEVTQNVSAFTANFTNFEYSLPPSTTALNVLVKFKFIAKTDTKTFERIYTVKVLSTGIRVLRLYNPVASTYYKGAALDLLNGTIVPANFPEDTKDMKALTALGNIGDKGELFTVLLGWASAVTSVPANQTKFKLKAKADFDKEPSTYAAAYGTTGAEITGASITASTGALAANQYYIAKIVRPTGVITYVGIQIRTLPVSSYSTITRLQDLSREYLEILIKK